MVEIKQFKIENIEPWIKYESNNYLDKGFEKVNFIFGDNGVGKTTFVNILKYLGKKNDIGQKFINKDIENNNYYQRLELGNYSFFDSNLGKIKEKSFKEKVFVFDDVFVNDNIFVVSSVIKNNSFDKNRKDKIEIVLQGELKGLYNKLDQEKENKKEFNKTKKEIENLINQLKEQFEKINKQIDKNSNLKLLEEGQNLKNLNQEKEKTIQKLQKINKDIEDYQNKLNKINEIEIKITKLKNIEKIIQKNNKQKGAIEKKLKEMKDLEEFYKKYGDRITDFLNLGFELWGKDKNICPFCQNKITEGKKEALNTLYDKLKENIKNLLNKKEELNKEYNIKTTEKKNIEKEIKDNKNIITEKENIEKQLEDLKNEKNILIKKQGEIEKNIENFEKYKEFEETKKGWFKEKDKIEEEIFKKENEQKKLEKKIEDISKYIKEIENKIMKKEKDFTKDFGNKINSYLDDLGFTNFNLKITRTKNLLKIEVIRGNKDGGEVISLSEGEKRALGLSFFLVLLENVDKKALKESIIVFDDPITSLDGKRRKATEELLNKLFWQENPKFIVKQIFAFTHDKTFFKYLTKTRIELKKGNKFTGIIYKTGNENKKNGIKRETCSFLVSYDFKKTYDSFVEKLQNIKDGNIKNNDNYFSLLIEGLHKLRFCIEYFIREEVFEYDNFEKVGPFIKRIGKISKKIKLEKKDIDNLSDLYDFCNRTGLHYENDDIQPTFEELRSKIKLFLEIKEKLKDMERK